MATNGIARSDNASVNGDGATAETTPLIGIIPTTNGTAVAGAVAYGNDDEEKGVPLTCNGVDVVMKNDASIDIENDKDGNSGSDNKTKKDEKKKKRKAPSWSEVLSELIPLIRPNDRRHTLLAILALATVMVEKVVDVLPPLAIRHAVDAVATYAASEAAAAYSSNSSVGIDDETLQQYAEERSAASRTIGLSILAYLGLKSVSSAISALQDVSQRTVSLDAERRFGVKLFAHLHRLGPAYHLERHAGELVRVLGRGADAASTVIDTLLFNLAPTLFEALVVSAVFYGLGTPAVAVTTVLSVVVYLAYTVGVTQFRIEQRRKVLEASDEVGRIETETLVNYETVTIFGRSDAEVERYSEIRSTYKKERVDMLGLFSMLQLGQKTIKLLGTCAGLWMAGRATVYGARTLGMGFGDGDDGDHMDDGGVGRHILSPGSFVVVQLYIQQLFQPLSYLGFTYRQLTQAFTDLEKAVTMLRSVPPVQDAPDAVDLPSASQSPSVSDEVNCNSVSRSPSGAITFDDVSYKYKVKSRRKNLGGGEIKENEKGRRGKGKMSKKGKLVHGGRGKKVWRGRGGGGGWIKDLPPENDDDEESEGEEVGVGGIQNVSFHVPAGKTVALVGHSGSGKTTIVRLCLRMYDVDSGSVSVDGLDVRTLKQQSLRSSIGVVAQDTVLFNASLRENITYGREDATDDEVWAAIRTAAITTFIKNLPDGLDTVVGERGMRLSGGERQRVGLARCVIKDPSLVLLDEATSALDSGTEAEIRQNIAVVCEGRTTLVIAHRLSTAMRADEILVLHEGRIVERGRHEELLALGDGGRYAKMWRDQTNGAPDDL